MLFAEPDTVHFLAAIQRLKRLLHRKQRLTRQAKHRVRRALQKLRSS